MKHIAILSALLLPPCVQAGGLKLTLHGTGLGGKNIHVAVHSSAADFPVNDDKAIKGAVLARAGMAELTIPNLPAGEYAVAVFADINGKLDSNFIGIPREPVGFSRDAKGRFGPPKFADAAFKVGDGVTAQTIQLK